jgi:hypothetical protein
MLRCSEERPAERDSVIFLRKDKVVRPIAFRELLSRCQGTYRGGKDVIHHLYFKNRRIKPKGGRDLPETGGLAEETLPPALATWGRSPRKLPCISLRPWPPCRILEKVVI